MNPNRQSWRPVMVLSAAFTAMAIFAAPQGPEVEPIRNLPVMVGKSVVITSAETIERVAVGFGDVAEAVAAGPNEVLVSGKAPGSTSLIVWQKGGGKLFFDIDVRPNPYMANSRLDRLRRAITAELPGQGVTAALDDETVFLRGKVKDLTSAGRAVAIASNFGKVTNLLYVDVPEAEQQILLKVRFASIDRSVEKQVGINLFSTGATNTIGRTGTGQFNPPSLPLSQQGNNPTQPFVFSDILNIFLFRPDLNLGATIKALEVKNLLQVLAEPNVLAQDGKQASFLAGGEFPYPVVQATGTNGIPTVTIQFHEFGVRLNFVPTITPRGTIRLKVAPEVSSLDYTAGITISGFNIPGISTRKVNTEVELGSGQSFAIAGLLDKRVTDSFQKMPLIGDLPVLGNFFKSKSTSRNNTELLVFVTPELVRPTQAAAASMDLPYPKPFMDSSPESDLRTPGADKTGPVSAPPAEKSIPIEKLLKSMADEKAEDAKKGNGGSQDDFTNEMPMPATTAAPKSLGKR